MRKHGYSHDAQTQVLNTRLNLEPMLEITADLTAFMVIAYVDIQVKVYGYTVLRYTS